MIVAAPDRRACGRTVTETGEAAVSRWPAGIVAVVLGEKGARDLARAKLALALPRRWRHVQVVAHTAENLTTLPGICGDLLVSAAWLHDIGYAPDVADVGFHPLDGGRFLRRAGAGERLARLVAHHSCAVHEARVRGLDGVLLAEFEPEDSVTYDALVFCDLTTGPDGESVTYAARIEEIRRRYGPDHEVTRAIELGEPDIAGCCERTLARIAGA